MRLGRAHTELDASKSHEQVGASIGRWRFIEGPGEKAGAGDGGSLGQGHVRGPNEGFHHPGVTCSVSLHGSSSGGQLGQTSKHRLQDGLGGQLRQAPSTLGVSGDLQGLDLRQEESEEEGVPPGRIRAR